MGLHASLSILSVTILYMGLMIQNHFLALERYGFQLGNALGPYQVLLRNNYSQAVFRKVLSVFPYSTQYLLYTAEDSSRAFQIKRDLADEKFKREYCAANSTYGCLKEIILVTNEKAPMNATGAILMIAVGATVIFKEKKKGDFRSTLESTLNLMELGKLIFNRIGRVEQFLLGFPLAEIQKLPPEVREKLDMVETPQQMTDFFFGPKMPELDQRIDRDLAEAYLLKRTEDQILGKFNSNLSKKMQGIGASVLNELGQEKVKKQLSEDEISSYSSLLRKYSW